MHLNIPNVDVYIDVDKLSDHELTTLAEEVAAEQNRRKPPLIELTLEERCLAKCGERLAAVKAVRNRVLPKPSLRQAIDAVDVYWRPRSE